MIKTLTIILILLSNTIYSQVENYGISGGLSFSFGNKVNRLGLSCSVFYSYNFAQINASVNAYYNFKSLALAKKTSEIQMGVGAQLAWTKTDSVCNNFVGLNENNTNYRNSFGYSFIHYFDWQNTSQSGGIFNISIDKFSFATQNDLFGGGTGVRDRYRTGALIFEYRYNQTKIGVKSVYWTGDYFKSTKITDSDYPARFGYRSSDKSILGNFTASLTSVQVSQILPYNQVARVNIGVDSERIRHILQNKLMHDQYFAPAKWIGVKQYHIPMLQANGEQYLFKDGQKVKPTSLYFNIGLNDTYFY